MRGVLYFKSSGLAKLPDLRPKTLNAALIKGIHRKLQLMTSKHPLLNKNLVLLIVCQGLFLTNNVTFIAINGLVGFSLAPLA